MEKPKLMVCMKWGVRYPADYVNRLYAMVARNMVGVPFQLVCFTDDPAGVRMEVDVRPLPAFDGVPQHLAVKPWRKLSLWAATLAPDLDGRDALFLDLDVVVTGGLAVFFDYQPGKYAVWENPTKAGQNIGNTSVFRFTVGKYPQIYDRFVADPEGLYRHEFRIEQEFISATLHALGEQVFWPRGWCMSFKEDLLPAWPRRLWQMAALPPACRIAVFHGKPDPDEARDGVWPSKWWKKPFKTLRPVVWVGELWKA